MSGRKLGAPTGASEGGGPGLQPTVPPNEGTEGVVRDLTTGIEGAKSPHPGLDFDNPEVKRIYHLGHVSMQSEIVEDSQRTLADVELIVDAIRRLQRQERWLEGSVMAEEAWLAEQVAVWWRIAADQREFCEEMVDELAELLRSEGVDP